jgi:hypothetical protein
MHLALASRDIVDCSLLIEDVYTMSRISVSMGSIDSGYDIAQILEVLINTLVQKNVISQQEADYIKQSGRGATFRQAQAGAEQMGQG